MAKYKVISKSYEWHPNENSWELEPIPYGQILDETREIYQKIYDPHKNKFHCQTVEWFKQKNPYDFKEVTEHSHKIKALDIVRTPKNAIAVVTETNTGGQSVSIVFIGENTTGEHNAWWNASDLTVIDSIPKILAKEMAHPFGNGKKDVELFF